MSWFKYQESNGRVYGSGCYATLVVLASDHQDVAIHTPCCAPAKRKMRDEDWKEKVEKGEEKEAKEERILVGVEEEEAGKEERRVMMLGK